MSKIVISGLLLQAVFHTPTFKGWITGSNPKKSFYIIALKLMPPICV